MLLQRHVNLVDSDEIAHFTDPKVADTIAFYANLVAGKEAVAVDASAMDETWAKSLENGDVAAAIVPDWKIAALREFAPNLAGRVRMMALPRFEADDAPTSTWGGTMIGIPRACAHPDHAWNLLEFLYLSPEGISARLARGSDILPALPQVWSWPEYHQADPYFGGQKVDELLVNLAGQIPQRDITPWSVEAQLALAEVLHRAEEHVGAHGNVALDAPIAIWLADAQREFQERIDFGKISP
jgi:ABC-type glycerol-3-phosphate transport system substrate-binding protein